MVGHPTTLEKTHRIKEPANRLEYEEAVTGIDEEIKKLDEEIKRLELLEAEAIEREAMPDAPEAARIETVRIEEMVEIAIDKVDEENKKIIVTELKKVEDKTDKNKIANLLKKIYKAATKTTKRKIVVYFMSTVSLGGGVAIPVALQYHTTDEYYSMFKNWKERHMDKYKTDDPHIKGIDILYDDQTDVERTTYDFLGTEKVNYKSGYYMTSVFDLADRTPPKFKVINDREYHTKIDDAAGITTNLFKPFYKFSDFQPQLKGHLDKSDEQKGDIPVIGYNSKTEIMRAGSYKEFNDDWMVSETYSIPLNFKLNEDGTINLVYHAQAMRMVPETINEKGVPYPFPIGIVADQKIKTFDPHKATHFGTLEGGKVVMVCGAKQLQVNGSFADMFRVYERLQKENPGNPITAYLLDNGSYNLPIWDKDNEITPEEIREHMLRNSDGGTALVLMNDGAISPYEYKNKYPEFEHHIVEDAIDPKTGQIAKNEHSVIVIHHTGNYENPQQIIDAFQDQNDPTKERSAHVLILKDGTRHLFNNDNAVLAHAGKSDFNDRDKVNFFSLGIEMEGDSIDGHQFTLAQLESMLEYMRPRIEKYGIPLENITTHKIIRDNYLRKHPEEKEVPTKRDLDDKVWEQMKDLIKKKLYENKKLALNDQMKIKLTEDQKVALAKAVGAKNKAEKGAWLTGAVAYQDAYRTTRDPKASLAVVGDMLKEFKVPYIDIKRTQDWIKNSS
jgi:N-acetyl-anhydromuramyl-L-alanine amidase AmpD